MSKLVNIHNRIAKYLVSCINILINVNSIKHTKKHFHDIEPVYCASVCDTIYLPLFALVSAIVIIQILSAIIHVRLHFFIFYKFMSVEVLRK